MADYWKSMEKKYCDICKCWITDNTASVQVHESGQRHRINSQTRLREIQKKARSNEKDEKKLASTLRRIEEAASLAVAQDKEANPDMSLKIQNYMEYLKEKEVEVSGGSPTISTSLKEVESNKPKILHREEKYRVDDSCFEPKVRPYTSRFGGWTSIESTPKMDLELPSSSYSVTAGKTLKSKSSSTAIIGAPSVTYTTKVKEKRKHVFEEKTLPPSFLSTPQTQSNSSLTTIKTEPSSLDVNFKKRKFSKSNVRQRLDD